MTKAEENQVRLEIWDIAPQERFRAMKAIGYKDAMGIILSYAVNDRESFQNLEDWMTQIEDYAYYAHEGVCKILIGNKCDMPDRCVDYEEGKRLAGFYGMKFFETSTKDARNINDVFNEITKQILLTPGLGSNGDQTKKLKTGNEQKSGKKGNCCS